MLKKGQRNSANAGMHAWFAAAADTRFAVTVPIIGVQVGLRFSIIKWKCL